MAFILGRYFLIKIGIIKLKNLVLLCGFSVFETKHTPEK